MAQPLWYIRHAGEVVGPYPRPQVEELLRSGELSGDWEISLDVLLGAAEPAATGDFTATAANDAFACGALEAMKQLADLVDQAAYA